MQMLPGNLLESMQSQRRFSRSKKGKSRQYRQVRLWQVQVVPACSEELVSSSLSRRTADRLQTELQALFQTKIVRNSKDSTTAISVKHTALYRGPCNMTFSRVGRPACTHPSGRSNHGWNSTIAQHHWSAGQTLQYRNLHTCKAAGKSLTC